MSNDARHPDILAAITAMPNVIQKPFCEVTQEDMMFNLHRQLEGFIAKEMRAQINGNHS